MIKTRSIAIVASLAGLVVCSAVFGQIVQRGYVFDKGQQIAFLESEFIRSGQELKLLDEQAKKLKAEMKDLTRQLSELKARPDKSTAEEKQPKVAEVKYRTPLARLALAKKDIQFICRNNKIFPIDFEVLNDAYQKIRRQPPQELLNAIKRIDASKKEVVRLSVPRGHLDFRVTLIKSDKGVEQLLELVPKPGGPGDPISKIDDTDSSYRKAIAAVSPETHNVQFDVYPDSYEIFRRAREIVWNHQFQVNWNPRAAGENLRPGGGGGGSLFQ